MEIMQAVMGGDLWAGAIVDIKTAMLGMIGLIVLVVGLEKLLSVLESPWYKKREEVSRLDKIKNYEDTEAKKQERATWKFKE